MAINYNLIGRALLHPTAAAILAALEGWPGPMTPKGLSKVLDEPLGNVSYHVKVLAGEDGSGKNPFATKPLLVLDHTEPRRGAVAHFYRLSAEAVR